MNRNSLERFALVVLLAAIAVILGPSTACAHTGVSPAHDLVHGLAHPLTGLDHVLAMFAVGLWAAQRGGRAIWLIPLTFVLVMTLGATLGISGVSIPFVESGIAISVLVLGIFVATAVCRLQSAPPSSASSRYSTAMPTAPKSPHPLPA